MEKKKSVYYLQVAQVVLWSVMTALTVPFCVVNLFMLRDNEYLSGNQKCGLAIAFVGFAVFVVVGLLSLIQELTMTRKQNESHGSKA